MNAPPSRRGPVIVALLVAVLLGGCKVGATVDVTVAEDGSGVVELTVRLDAAAVRALESGGATLEEAVLLDDLRDGGWEVDAWQREGRRATLRMRKEFARLSDLPIVLGELDGSPGFVRDVEVDRSSGRLRTTHEISMVLDLESIQSGIAEDRAIASALRTAGVSVEEIDTAADRAARDALTLRVNVTMPYGETAEWVVRAGDNRRVTVAETHTDTAPIRWALVALAALLIAFALLIAASRSAFKERSRAARRPPVPPAS